MKKRLLQTFLVLLAIAAVATIAVAQKVATIPQVQGQNVVGIMDSLRAADTLQNSSSAKYKDKSPYWHGSDATGADTVTVTGVVMVKSGVVTYTLLRNNIWIQDTTTGQLWGGLEILTSDSTAAGASGTGISAIDTGMVVTITGRVTEYGPSTNNGMTEMFVYNTAAPIYTSPPPISIVGYLSSRPAPKEITLDSLCKGNTPLPSRGEKYESMFVIIRNVTITAVDYGSGAFTFQDANGNIGRMYDGSGFYTLRGHRLSGSKYYPYPVGTKLAYIQGIVTVQPRSGTFGDYTIMPVYPGPEQLTGSTYPGDIAVAPNGFAPTISLVKRTPTPPGPTDVVSVSWKAKNLNAGGVIDSSILNYKIGTAAMVRLKVSPTLGDSLYTGTIPAANGDSLVSYYIKAYGGGTYGTFPDSSIPYFYQIRGTAGSSYSIYDIQYTPFVAGISGFIGDTLTVRGIISADTTDIKDQQSGRPTLWMASKAGAWNGINIWGSTAGVGLDTLVRGDSIEVRGVVNETSGLGTEGYTHRTTMKVVSRTVLARGRTVPAATLIKLNASPYIDYSLNNPPLKGVSKFEQYEGVLVVTQSPLYLVVMNADNLLSTSSSNYGEFFLSTANLNDPVNNIYGLRVDDNGCNTYYADTTTGYTTRWAIDHTDPGQPTKKNLIKLGWTIAGITGIMDFSHDWYKIEPRKNSDFGTITGVFQEANVMPKTYSLAQNYPNPFNPSTTISYSIPEAANVTVKVFNLLGQEVATLLDHQQNAGSYKLVFDASRFATGVYFYQLRAGDFTNIKKMVLLK
jgi:hypothetical protein